MNFLRAKNWNYASLFFLSIILILSCKQKTKVIEEETEPTASSTQIEQNSLNSEPAGIADMHQVIAREVLNTSKYTYIKVQEDKDTFWIAVSKQEVKVGKEYYFRNGLKKTDFYSQEFQRTFPQLLLVSNFVSADQHPGGQLNSNTASEESEPASHNHQHDESITNDPSFISLLTLFEDTKKYNQKNIKVHGEIVKANYQIMNRNWYHIQAKNTKGKILDLTITSQENIKVGDHASFEGMLSLNKDFGSGYRYNVILEDATLIKN